MLLGILILAAALRLAVPGITEFKRDEANLSQLALNLAQGRDVPLLGITSSTGVPNSPLSVYLFALPYVFDHTPILATLFVGILNVIAVELTWELARRYYGSLPAMIAALLYAASPWAAIYSRKIWAQDLLPPFVVATVLTGLLGYGEDKRWARWLHWPLLAITVQIHYGAFTLIPLSLLMLLLWRVHWRDLAVGLLLAALTLLPALAGAYRDDLLKLDTLRGGLDSEPDRRAVVDSTALDYAWFTVAGTDIHSLAGPEQYRRYLDSVPDAYPLFKALPLLAALTAGALLWQSVRKRRNVESPDVILAAWLALPVLAFTWQWTTVAPHYMIPLMPAAFILCGIGITRLGMLRPAIPLRLALIAGLFAVVALQVVLYANLIAFLDTHDTPGGFGTPLHSLLDIREAVLARDPVDVIVVSDQEVAPYDEIPAVWGVLLDPVPQVRFVDGTRTVVIPADSALELVAHTPGVTYLAPYERDPVESFEHFALRGDAGFYALRPAEAWTPDDLRSIEPVRFSNGAALSGYALAEGGVWLQWTLGDPPGADFQAFVHALDADGQKLAQADRGAWPGRYWRAGDTLYLWFDLPPDAAALYAGMYTTDGVTYQNAAVVDVNGAVLDQGATLDLGK